MDDRNGQRRIGVKRIILTEQQKKILVNHAHNEMPNESCAILFGSTKYDKVIVSETFLTENIEKSPHKFAISNKQLIIAYSIAEEKGTNVVGIFHSHPDSEAHPSNIDKEFMCVNPIPWVIYSGKNCQFKAFVAEDNIREIEIG